MELSDFFRIVRQRGWLLVLLALVGAASGYVFSRLQTPIYKSSMKLTVQPARTDFGLTQSAKTLLLSYIQIIWTETNAAEVANRLKLDYEPGRIFGNTKMADEAASFGIEIQVTDANGEVANDIARTWADLMIEYRNDENTKQRREDRVNIVRGDPPRYSQDRPRTSINTIAGGLLGAVLGVGLIAALEALAAASVRGRADIERRLNIPVLAAIPAEAAK
jgi:capsular polysaccharide biosynthesis protein